jgi:hypothetical protein
MRVGHLRAIEIQGSIRGAHGEQPVGAQQVPRLQPVLERQVQRQQTRLSRELLQRAAAAAPAGAQAQTE